MADGGEPRRILIRGGVYVEIPPEAPAGGPGNGYFTVMVRVYDHAVAESYRLAGQMREGLEIVGQYTLEQIVGVQCVYRAVMKAPSFTVDDTLKETGQALDEVIQAIVPGLLISAAVLALTTIAGATVGALLGACAGGAGAIPGGLAGGAGGLELGMTMLSWLGIGMLVVHFGTKFYQVDNLIKGGVSRAWKARYLQGGAQDQEVIEAAHMMSRGMALWIRLILEGVVLYLTAKAGNKIGDITSKLREGRFARFFKLDRLARWLDENYLKLLKEPKLKPKGEGGTTAPEGAVEPVGPQKPSAPKEPTAADAAQSAKAKKAQTLKNNNKNGKTREAQVKKELEAEGHEVVGSQVTIKTPETNRIADHLIREKGTGQLKNIEVKSGGAKRSGLQIKKDNAMENVGGKIIGKNAPKELRGQTFKITTEVRH